MSIFDNIDVTALANAGQCLPVMVEVVRATNGNIFFKSDDGLVAYRRYSDVREAIEYGANFQLDPQELATAVRIKARKELHEEQFEEAVQAEKERLKTQKRRWLPWRIKLTIERRS